jgi:hypothetical protein
VGEEKILYCEGRIDPGVVFRGSGLPYYREERGCAPVEFEDKGAVLYCNRFDHEHTWPPDYTPLNPRPR